MKQVRRKSSFAWLHLFSPRVKSWGATLFFKPKPSFDGLRPSGWRSFASLTLVLSMTVTSVGVIFQSLSDNAYADVNSVRPNGEGSIATGWVTSTGAATGLSGEMDDDPDSPNDSDYVKTANRTSSSSYFMLQDLPINFAGATSVEIKTRHRENGAGNDTSALTYSIVQSDESTAITSSSTINLPNNGAYQTDTMALSVTGANTKTAWDGARLKITLAISQQQSPDDAPANISAVEVNVTYSPLVTLEQSSYRFFANTDSTSVGSSLAAQDTAATLTAPGQAFRLRTNIHVSAADLGVSGKTFKLQYASKGASTCSALGSYADVTTTTPIAYKNNATPADGTALTPNASDPTHASDTIVKQTYEEANNFTNSVAGILAGQDGMWDFALYDNGAAAGDTYCLRIVESSGTALYGYTVYPEVTTSPPTITQRAYIFEQDDGTTVNTNTDNGTANTALTNVKIGERLEARIQIDYTDVSTLSNATFQLYYDKNDGNFTPVKAGAEIQPTTGVSGTTGDALTSAAAGTCTSGTSYTNGQWNEQTSVSRPITLMSNQCTELAFMIDTSNASANTTYRLKLMKGITNFAGYTNYPTLTTVASAAGQIRTSKDSLASLPNCTDTAWGCETIDSSVIAGELWISMSLDHNGDPWVSYYDETNSDLKVAHYVGSGGNCTSTKWDCTRVDISSNATGSNSSIGVDPQGRVWISYRDNSNDLKVAVNYDHPNMNACSAAGWDCIVVENTANDLAYESSIAFDKNGNPWISYNDSTAFAVRVATYVGSGGNCTASSWNCNELDALGSASLDGDWSSINFDSQGYAWVSYTDYTNTALKVATTKPGGFTGAAACTLSGWTCGIVDNTGTTSGEATTLAIQPGTDAPWIAYEHEGNGELRYAKFVGSGGNCSSSAWDCAAVDNNVGVVPDPSIAFDPAGTAWIAFFNDTVSTGREYKVVKYVGSGGSGCSSTAWQCSAVDSTSSQMGEYGHDKAFKFDASGTAWGAYQDASGQDLRIAKMHRPNYHNPLKYELDNKGYTATSTANSSFDQLPATTNLPMYKFTSVHTNNTDTIAPTWVGRSNVAAGTNAIRVQIYRYGTTKAWQDIATNTSCTANNTCTITPTTISTNLSEYYQTEGSNYLLHFRVLQDSGTTKTLETDNFSLASLSGGSNTAPSSPTSPAQIKVTGGATVSTGGWTNENQIKLTASATDPDASDTLELCVEAKPIATAFTGTGEVCGTGVAYSGSAITVESTLTGLTENEYHWQARVKDAGGLYSSWVSYGGNAETIRDYGVDTTVPTGTVYDGSSVGVDATLNDGSLSTLSANWTSTTTISGLSGYEYSIGTTAGGTTIRGWTSTGTGTSVTANSLSLSTSQTYYFNVKITDNAGNTGIVSSNGVMVAPTLTFSSSTNTVSLGALNASNSYTNSQTLTLTTATNAQNGYKVYAKATDFLKSQSLEIVPMFNGGTYASPAAWGTNKGFGYHSSDTSVGGSNRFNSATCLGGGSAPCFAPYITSGSGDVVADTTTPATNNAVTITNKAAVDSTSQKAGNYQTTVLYSAYATY